MGNPAGVRRDFEALEKRRFQAMRLLDQGLNQSEVARWLKVVRQTVARWVRQCRQRGTEGLQKAGRAGRKPLLSQADWKRLEQLLLEEPEGLGYETPLWTCPRVAHMIEQEFGVRYHEGPRLEGPGQPAMESPTAYRQGAGAERGTDPYLA